MKMHARRIFCLMAFVLAVGLSYATVRQAFAENFCDNACSPNPSCWAGEPNVQWNTWVQPDPVNALSNGSFTFTIEILWNYDGSGPIGAAIMMNSTGNSNILGDPEYTPDAFVPGCSCACGALAIEVSGFLDQECQNGTLTSRAEFYDGVGTVSDTKSVTINEGCP